MAEQPTADELLKKIQGFCGTSHDKLDEVDYQNAVSAALARYSAHAQKSAVTDIVGSGAHDYDPPAGWVDGFSEIQQIEYPIGQTPETLLDAEDWSLYQSPAGLVLRLVNIAPDATESFRVTHTVLRATADIREHDLDAFAALAASICFEMLAGAYVGVGDPTLQADVVNYRSKSGESAARAKALYKYYKSHMALPDDNDSPAAAVVGSQTINYPGGQDRLTHPRRQRNLR